jgi:hypothetical protein
MQIIIFYKRAYVIILLLLISSVVFTQEQPEEKKNERCLNIGLNYSRVSLMPYLSLDYRKIKKIGITVEFTPIIRIPNYFGIRVLDPIMNSEYSNGLTYNGFFTNLIFYYPKSEDDRWHFTPAVELSFSQQFRKNHRVNIHTQENPCDGFPNSDYNYISIKSRTALTAVLFYGKSHLKMFIGLGIGRINSYNRGYNEYGNSSNPIITPFQETDVYYKPVVKLGFRLGLDVF